MYLNISSILKIRKNFCIPKATIVKEIEKVKNLVHFVIESYEQSHLYPEDIEFLIYLSIFSSIFHWFYIKIF